ncbi:MAG TPA: hypothetical protein VJN67_06475 [Stellaceae bacterium]|nr:hypothetical protein [Stellaceae bacterium]
MSTVLSSMSEIVRVGGWALRGIGYPFGVAERGVRLLAWTEAAGGEAIKHLRLSETAVEQSHSAAPCERAGDAGSGRVLHANGRHLLEIGPPAIDLATHDARHGSLGHVAVDSVFGFGFLPSLANLLAHRKLSGVFLYAAADGDRPPEGWPRTGWLAVETMAEGPLLIHGALDGEVGLALRAALATLPSRFLDGTPQNIAAASERGHMTIFATPDAHGPVRDLVGAMRALAGDRATPDFPRRVAHALSNGVPMAADDLKYLYDLELRTWAPTSERSRSQAGYGVF